MNFSNKLEKNKKDQRWKTFCESYKKLVRQNALQEVISFLIRVENKGHVPPPGASIGGAERGCDTLLAT